jgi:hypothetical protein
MPLLIILILLALLVVFGGRGKRVAPSRTEQQKQNDELITVILPTINNDK